MKNRWRFTVRVFVWATLLAVTYAVAAQAQTHNTTSQSLAKKSNTPQAANGAVSGGGTPGRISKWAGVAGSSTFVLGDSGIFEDKFGKVGIGTITPTSPLTVQGMIETTLGGYKFPDGTVQTSAGLGSIFHDATLKGDGTQASPLGIAVPLVLNGSAIRTLTVTNTFEQGIGIASEGGNTTALFGGAGIFGKGGDATGAAGLPGTGVIGRGGINTATNGGEGGEGVSARGGVGNYQGGNGLTAIAGDGLTFGGHGMRAVGGLGGSPNAGISGFGGNGIIATGGFGNGAGHHGGAGILAGRGKGFGGATDGPAGLFQGDVEVQGSFNVTGGGSKNFKIDHPLDPENKYLYHAAIESSEVLNVYSGNVTTNAQGEAIVTLPEWFEAINKDFRYQLTVVGQFAQAIVASKVKDNRFTVKTNGANVEVSWQVTGVRSDAAILKHPFKLEDAKPQSERGFYLTPEAYDQPAERGIEWARNPRLMQELKEQRLETEQQPKANKN